MQIYFFSLSFFPIESLKEEVLGVDHHNHYRFFQSLFEIFGLISNFLQNKALQILVPSSLRGFLQTSVQKFPHDCLQNFLQNHIKNSLPNFLHNFFHHFLRVRFQCR